MKSDFLSVQEAYISSLRNLHKNGVRVKSVVDKKSVGSDFGRRERDFIELQGYGFTILNPRNRYIYSQRRKMSFGFCIANFIWLLSGKKDVETICFYNNKGLAFSSNGEYYEAAFGDRLFGSYSLIESAIRLIQKDNTTRRALIPMFLPTDLISLPLDTPCASSIQIMVRGNKVDFFLHMRSQAVVSVFPYDIFLFTMLHEYISLALGIPMGKFNYYCNSFHYYLEEDLLVKAILKEKTSIPVEMDKMTSGTIKLLPTILEFEKRIRYNVSSNIPMKNTNFNFLPSYWKNLFKVLYTKALHENTEMTCCLNCKYLNNKELFI